MEEGRSSIVVRSIGGHFSCYECPDLEVFRVTGNVCFNLVISLSNAFRDCDRCVCC